MLEKVIIILYFLAMPLFVGLSIFQFFAWRRTMEAMVIDTYKKDIGRDISVGIWYPCMNISIYRERLLIDPVRSEPIQDN